MDEDSITKLLNPDGYCVPELKDFFKKREPLHSEKSGKKKKHDFLEKNAAKKLKTGEDKVSSRVESDILNSSMHVEDSLSDDENEDEVPTAKRVRTRRKKVPRDTERESRTVFVGNLPNTWGKLKIKRFFSKYGTVESVRLRCPPLADPRVPKKVAVITKDFHPDRTNINGFVRFVDEKSAANALRANGTVLDDHHIRVDLALNNAGVEHDKRKAIFVGNLPFSAEEDQLWTFFENCGEIEYVRVFRDRYTGVGKGFAFVNFKTPDAVELALQLNGDALQDRALRISRFATFKKKKERKEKKMKSGDKINKAKPRKRTAGNEASKVTDGGAAVEGRKTPEHKQPSGAKAVKFQGQTGGKKLKKKKKISKDDQRKKILIKKLAGGLSKKKVM